MSDLKQPTTVLIFVSSFSLFFVAIFFLSVSILKIEQAEKKITEIPPSEKAKLAPVDHFTNLALEAKAAYVLDAQTGKVLFARNEESQLPLASLTKVMTAFVASDMPEDTVVAVSDGEKWNLKKLLDYTLVVSSNDGASAIAGVGSAFFGAREKKENKTETKDTNLFIEKMNEEAQRLHLAQTFFLNPNGLDIDDTLSGAYGSAKDMALLFMHVLKNKPLLMEATAYDSLHFDSLDGIRHSAENTNIIARTIPGLLASKTGYTDLAQGNLVVAFDLGPVHPVIVAVLGSSQEGRFADVEKLVNASMYAVAQE